MILLIYRPKKEKGKQIVEQGLLVGAGAGTSRTSPHGPNAFRLRAVLKRFDERETVLHVGQRVFGERETVELVDNASLTKERLSNLSTTRLQLSLYSRTKKNKQT